MLIEAGIAPVCGAVLPGGPQTHDSSCQAAGVQTFANPDGSSLHLDHEPPLTDAERQDARSVCNAFRIQLLCSADHAIKTQRERRGGRENVAHHPV